MAYIVADRVKETTTVTGTGPATLAGAASGYRSFASQLSIGDTCAYVIVNSNGSEWEVGIGTYSAVNTLTRTTVHASTNSNAAVVFTAGVKDVFLGPTSGSFPKYNPITNTITSGTWAGNSITPSQVSGTAVITTDSRLSDSRTPSGSAGGDLTGSYPNPTLAAVGTSGIYTKVTTDSKGRIISGTTLSASDVPTLNQNTTGTAANVTGIIAIANGGTNASTAASALTNLGAYPSNNPSGYTTNLGTVTSVAGTGTVNGLTLTGTVTDSGVITLGGTLSINPSQVTGTAVITSDSRLSDSRTPSGSAGGVLAGTYPSPSFASTTGSGSVVLSTTPTLVTPQSNSLSAVPVGSGAGNSLTLAAGSGVGTGAGGNLVLQAGIQATTGGDGKVVVKQTTGQTSNLQEWQNSSGSALASLDTTGRMTVPYLNATGGTYSAASPALVLGTGTGFYYSNPYIYFCAGNNSAIQMSPAGGQLIVNVNGQPGSTSGQVLVRPGNGGGAQVNCIVVQSNPNQGSYLMYTVTGHGAMTIAPDVPSVSCVTLNGSAAYTLTATNKSLTANVATITVSGGTPRIDVGDTVVVALSPADAVFDGTYTISAKSGNNLSYARTNTNVASTATTGTVSSTATTTLQNINIGVPGAKGLVIKAAASQTANLQEWQNSSGTALALVDSAGTISAGALVLTTTNNVGSSLRFGSGSLSIGWYSGDYFGLNNSEMVLGTITNSSFSNSSVAVRNSTAPQNFRVYNTFTSSTAYERLGISWASNICTIGVEQAGGGVQRVLNVNANNINAPTLPTAATVTAATGNGTTVTYTAANTFSVGQVVSITGLTTTTGSSLNLSNQTITTASATQFTITNATVGTAAATQAGTATIQSAGNSVTITAGNGSGVGAGGNIILQPGAQGSSGGNGSTIIKKASGSNAIVVDEVNDTITLSATNITGFGRCLSSVLFMNGTTVYFRNSAGYQGGGLAAVSTGVLKFYNPVTASDGCSIAYPSYTVSLAANQNDYSLNSHVFNRINCTSACSITGIAPNASAGSAHEDGRMIRIYNVGTANLTLAHNSASSTAANRMFNSTGADIILAPNDYAELIYDSTSNGSGAAGWRVS